jgi:riboflavin transporter
LNRIFKLVLAGLFVAIDVIAAVFLTIPVNPYLKIGFTFLPVSLAGMMLGPWFGGAAAGVSDILQAFMVARGAPIPGITLDMFFSGALYGFLLYGKKPSIIRCLIAAAGSELLIGGLLTTFWLYLAMPGQTFFALFAARIIKALVMTPIETLMIFGMWQLAGRTKGIRDYLNPGKQ